MSENCIKEAFELLKAGHLKLSAAESCTGGLFTKLLTDFAGSSEVLDLSMVTYANEAKIKFLGVPPELIERHGVVSREVAACMAEGICRTFGAQVGIGITGIAGPGGATADKPVGLVWTAICFNSNTYTCELRLDGTREQIRYNTCLRVYENLCKLLKN